MNIRPSSSDRDAPEDFWDLGDADLQPPRPNEGTEEVASSDGESPIPEEPPAAEAPPVNPTPLATPQMPEAPAAEPAKSSRRRSQQGDKYNVKPVKVEHTSLSLVEKLSLAVLIVGLIGAVVWAVSTYAKEAPQGELVTFDTEFPVEGNGVTVAEIETWWRKPVRTGDNPDRGVVMEANLIPCARIRIGDSVDAILQVTFRNGERNLVGDPITLEIRDGKFAESGRDDITIHSTSGFTSASDLNAYTNGDIDPWSVVIVDPGQENSEDPLLKVRIDPTFQD